MTYATTQTTTYSTQDIEQVFRSFKQELVMIAQSSAATTIKRAEDSGHDAEYLAKKGYLQSVDVTLFDASSNEVRAMRYTVNKSAGDINTSRVGGVLWPKTPTGSVRIVLYYTQEWHDLSDDAKNRVKGSLKSSWTPTDADTSHSTLKSSGGRAFAKNGYALEREDFSK